MSSKYDRSAARAWLIDGFGGAYGVGPKTTIGRNLACDMVVLASSVSREHAELAQGEAGWTIRDLGSRNGTFVDGIRVDGEAAVPAHAVIKIGDVALWFLAKMVTELPTRPEVATGKLAGASGLWRSETTNGSPAAMLVRYQFEYGDRELCVVAGDAMIGGALLWRVAGSDSWSERRLAPLEYQLLRTLCIRAHAEAASPLQIRGCMSSKQLLRELMFQSKYANQENVRQVVLRLRTALAEVGADGVLAVAPGRGYYLLSRVTAAGVDRP